VKNHGVHPVIVTVISPAAQEIVISHVSVGVTKLIIWVDPFNAVLIVLVTIGSTVLS